MFYLSGILSVIFVLFGIVELFDGNIGWMILWWVLACVVGPGGYSIFRER